MPARAGPSTVEAMEVTFTKLHGRRYRMTVVRERGPELAPRQGPGYDGRLPHDAVHLLVEAEAGLRGGAFGRIAAGRSNIFFPADPAQRRRQARKEAKSPPSAADRADMARSEQLAGVCQAQWELRSGRRSQLPEWYGLLKPETVPAALLNRIVGRLDEFAERWRELPVGGSVTVPWPGLRAGSASRTGGRTGGRTGNRSGGRARARRRSAL